MVKRRGTSSPLQEVDEAFEFTSDAVLSLSAWGRRERLPAGRVIFEQGDMGSQLHIVEAGEVKLVFDAGRKIKTVRPGGWFGELALISGEQKRTATAVTTQDSIIQTVGQEAFADFIRSDATAAVTLLRETCNTLLRSEQQLSQQLAQRTREFDMAMDFLRRSREDLDAAEMRANADDLTSLYNRRCLKRQSPSMLHRARETGEELALILIDLDHFKRINDTHGHPMGDLVLQRFAKMLRDTVRHTDLPCRIGGDEFAVLLSNRGEEDSKGVARRILSDTVRLPLVVPGGRLRLTASVGGTQLLPTDQWATLFKRADQNLYLAKHSGRNRFGWNGVVDAIGPDA